jgi:hypothetical protein
VKDSAATRRNREPSYHVSARHFCHLRRWHPLASVRADANRIRGTGKRSRNWLASLMPSELPSKHKPSHPPPRNAANPALRRAGGLWPTSKRVCDGGGGECSKIPLHVIPNCPHPSRTSHSLLNHSTFRATGSTGLFISSSAAAVHPSRARKMFCRRSRFEWAVPSSIRRMGAAGLASTTMAMSTTPPMHHYPVTARPPVFIHVPIHGLSLHATFFSTKRLAKSLVSVIVGWMAPGPITVNLHDALH